MRFGWLDFKITNRCNNKCTYCGVVQDPPRVQEKIPLNRIIATNKDALEMGFNYFAFLGGEPTLRTDFPQIMETFSQESNQANLLLITNMKVYEESCYRSLFGTHSLSASLVASIDRLTTPNYKQQNSNEVLTHLWNIQELARSYLEYGDRYVQVHCVISRENFREFPSLIRFFSQKHISVSLAIVEPLNVVVAPSRYNEFTREELLILLDQLNELEAKNILEFPNRVLRDYLTQYLTNHIQFSRCNAGIEHVIIEADGNVYPCLTESYRCGLSFGNIINEAFPVIYKKMQQFKCSHPLVDTCWDHFLWNRLGDHERNLYKCLS